MAFPLIPVLLGAGALLFVMTGKSGAASPAAPAGGTRLSLSAFSDPTPNARLLRLGSKGEDVASWQRVLKRLGYDVGTFGPNGDGVDGNFGPTTDRVTRELQSWAVTRTRDPQIQVDGVVGPVTRRLVLLRTADMKAAAA
jgi:peptidoglycan hydrolase-like protein with peptidoglycan-binding domain